MNIQDKSLYTLQAKEEPLDQILIRGFSPLASIGLFERERQSRQPVSIDIDLDILPLAPDEPVTPNNIVRYDYICAAISEFIEGQHIDLVESLAESIAEICLSYDRSTRVKVTVTKPDALEDAAAVGVSIFRTK